MSELVMPSLGADMEDGKIVEWLVQPGDKIKRGDVVAVVETQKGAIEIESFDEGVLIKALVELGQTVPVGTPLAMIEREGNAAAVSAAKQAPETFEKTADAIASPLAGKTPAISRRVSAGTDAGSTEKVGQGMEVAGRVRISPAARRLARTSQIDLAGIHGSGPNGAIVRSDILARTGSGDEAKPPVDDKLSGMRAAIAGAMSRSKREIPHYYLSDSVDVTAAQEFVLKRNSGKPPAERLLIGALFLKAVALAARKYPEFNGHYEDGVFHPGNAVHAGMAINIRGGGLVAPAIHHAEDLSLDELMSRMRDLVTRVRAGRFRSSELSDPTITVSSLGDRGVEVLYGVIHPPQVAIVGFGMPVERAWVREGKILPRQIVTGTLAADHRVSDGHRGARFLNLVTTLLEAPENL